MCITSLVRDPLVFILDNGYNIMRVPHQHRELGSRKARADAGLERETMCKERNKRVPIRNVIRSIDNDTD